MLKRIYVWIYNINNWKKAIINDLLADYLSICLPFGDKFVDGKMNYIFIYYYQFTMKTKHLCVALILSLLAFQACTTDDVSFTEDSGPDD